MTKLLCCWGLNDSLGPHFQSILGAGDTILVAWETAGGGWEASGGRLETAGGARG